MGGNAAILLSLLSLSPKRKVKCFNRYFINGYEFHTEEYEHRRKTYNNGVCIKGSTCIEFEVDYHEKLEEVVEFHLIFLQYTKMRKNRRFE